MTNFTRLKLLSIFCCLMLISLASANSPIENAKRKLDDKSVEAAKRWDNVMSDFRRWDSENAFPEAGILFVGSSSINLWKTRECFPDLPVINRGFGGSIYSDIIYWAETLIAPYDPEIIVFYSGDNDPYRGKTPTQIFGDFRLLTSLVWQLYPETDIIVMATKFSQSREDKRKAFTDANRLFEEYAEKKQKLHYFDSASILLDDQGKPDANLYRDDKLHLNDAGYEIWSKKLRPLIGSITE